MQGKCLFYSVRKMFVKIFYDFNVCEWKNVYKCRKLIKKCRKYQKKYKIFNFP